MKKIRNIHLYLTLLLAALFALPVDLTAGPRRKTKPPSASSTWQKVTHDGKGNWPYYNTTTSGTDLATINVADMPINEWFSFVVTKTLPGDYTGKTLSAVSELIGDVQYWGEGTSANNCYGTPANVRFVIMTVQNYSDAGAASSAWFSNPVSVELLAGGSLVLQATINSLQWSDLYGHSASDPAYTASFQASVKKIVAAGLALGGGCFFDVGVKPQSPSIPTYFSLKSFSVL